MGRISRDARHDWFSSESVYSGRMERTPMSTNDAPESAVLDVRMDRNDAGAATIRDYLIELLLGVWREGEGFDGKRPFGNSSWEFEVYQALGKAGLIECEFDGDYIGDCDTEAADRLISGAIKALR